jgi:surfeit locus 1 family protein
VSRAARIGYALAALCGVALFTLLGTWQLGRGLAKQERIAQQAVALDTQAPSDLVQEAWNEAALDRIDSVVGRDRFRAPLLLLDNQQRGGRVGVRVYALTATTPVLVDLGWVPWSGQRTLPSLSLPEGERELRGLLAPWPGQGLRLAATPWPEQRDAPVLLTTLDRADIEAALGVRLAPRVLRLAPDLDYGYARDLDPLPNTLPPERHFGYAAQWYGLAATVAVIYFLLARRTRRRVSL